VVDQPNLSDVEAPAGSGLGQSLRARRRHARLTLKELGAKAGLSFPFISQIERGQATPSMSALRRLAEALDTTPQALLADGDAATVAASHRPLPVSDAGLVDGQCRMLGPTDDELHVLDFSGAPASFLEYWSHAGAEHVYVVAGTVELDLDGELTTLGPGDSRSYEATTPHRYRQVGDVRARFLLIELPRPAQRSGEPGGSGAAWTNTMQLRTIDPPVAVEHLVYEVRASAFEQWKAAEFEMWTKWEGDRFPGNLGKETWVQDLGEWIRVSIVIYWRTLDDWLTIDHGLLEAQEQAFSDRVGADNYRLVHFGHDTGEHYYKVSEYR
jgi:uncharacterized protein (TIGR03792 family)